MIPDAILGLIGNIAVAGTEDIPQGFIGLALDIPVVDQQADGGAGGLTLKDTGQDLYGIGLPAGGGVDGSARPSPRQLRINIRGRKGQAGRTAVDDRAQGRAVGFAPGRHPEDFAKGIAAHGSECSQVLTSCRICSTNSSTEAVSTVKVTSAAAW